MRLLMFGLSKIAARIAMGAIALVLVLGFLQVRSCQQARQRAAEARLDKHQDRAVVESAKDAIKTQGEVAAAQAASKDLNRTNAEEIDRAKDAGTRAPDAYAASLRALCRREAHRNSERCRLYVTPSP